MSKWPGFVLIFLYGAVNAAELQLRITNIQSSEGKTLLQMVDSESDFTGKSGNSYMSLVLPLHSNELKFEIGPIPVGDYAIRIFHDENNNQKLGTNFLGIPKEPYGFSNDATGKFGPEKWKDARLGQLQPEIGPTSAP